MAPQPSPRNEPGSRHCQDYGHRILFQFDPWYPPACELSGSDESMVGPINFSLQGVWSVGAKGLWADLSSLESEVVGYWHTSRRLHYNIRGAPIVYIFVDHRLFAELYKKKAMSELSPRMLLQELME